MPLTPVIVTAWLDPPEGTDFTVGQSVTMHAAVVDRITKVPVTPDIFFFSSNNPPVSSGPATLTATQDATGDYHVDVALNVAGTWILQAVVQGNPGAVGIGLAALVIQVTPGAI